MKTELNNEWSQHVMFGRQLWFCTFHLLEPTPFFRICIFLSAPENHFTPRYYLHLARLEGKLLDVPRVAPEMYEHHSMGISDLTPHRLNWNAWLWSPELHILMSLRSLGDGCIETFGKQWPGPPNKEVMEGWKECTGNLGTTLTSKSWPFEGKGQGKEAKGNFYTLDGVWASVFHRNSISHLHAAVSSQMSWVLFFLTGDE